MKVNRTYKLVCFIISIIVSAAFLYNAAPAFSSDEMFLNGIVKKVNPKSRIVTIDVKSIGCKGEKSFEAQDDDIGIFQDVLGKEIAFFIDSSTCKEDRTYTIKEVRLKAMPKGVKK